jgi:hypothetical protein
MSTADSDAWLESFSLRTYRPMLRLASGSDRNYLAGTRDPREVRDYRRKQRSLLREYLRGLSRDFQKLNTIAAAKERAAKEHSPDLWDGKLSFAFSVLWIEARLAIQSLFPQAIEMESLLRSVDELARTTREMARPVLRLHVT